MELNQVTVPCVDYDESVDFYTRLGLKQIVDSPPHYARFETPGGTTLSIHTSDARAGDGVVIYFEVDDLDATFRRLGEQGFEFETAPRDQRWLWREAYLRDPASNRVCLFHAGSNRRFPPWRIDGEAPRG